MQEMLCLGNMLKAGDPCIIKASIAIHRVDSQVKAPEARHVLEEMRALARLCLDLLQTCLYNDMGIRYL